MPVLNLYNTLTRRVEPFAPLDPAGKVITFYSCGPTVYDFAHIGNFRAFLNADLLRRTLELLRYSVRHVMNMTDVGHMTDDEVADGGGEDKMQEASRRLLEAKKAGKLPPDAGDVDASSPWAIADYYINAFQRDARLLGLKVALEEEADAKNRAPGAPSPFMPRPTQYVKGMIELIQRLIERGHAYVARDGVVYFDVKSFPAYGQLSGNTLENLRAGEGGRVSDANQAVKRHPADFMLWKPDSTHIMKWPSPWGEGYPGWHIECSVMAKALLGEEIDIHSGGEDNIFPHHECEIAQTCSATGRPAFARHWFHTRHLFVEGEKMSKSRGNFYTLRDLLAKGASPAAVRLAITSTHYRSNANFTMQGLRDAQKQVERWMRVRGVRGEPPAASRGAGADGAATRRGPLQSALERFTAALCDDLNVAGAIAALNEGVNATEALGGAGAPTSDEAAALGAMLDTLGIGGLAVESTSPPDDLSTRVELLLKERTAARQAKNWAESDRIRDELKAMGVAIKDGPSGTTWERVIE